MKALHKEIQQSLHNEQFDLTEEGLYLPRQGIMVKGEYFDRLNDGEWERTPNLVVTEGLAHILNTALGSTAKAAGYYLALFSGATAPAANWTAANFASVASEIVSTTEGYTNATRPEWTPANTTTGSIDNMSATASLTIATTSTLNVTGAALLTNSTRGGTSGVLISATKFSATRTFQSGDVYQVGYRLSLTV
ncbi:MULTISPECIES: hypothetical protein [unclassified Acinetobacter]|uniref:hypothetical protein n=1 Tax=unclassified Acinetobacter TaxID=196816 RepID=UPI000E5B87BC|nr:MULTISPECIES: hypothetical protein [unclassified Acinetobacter]RGD90572.1 hypothetical protein DYI96_10405 [Acinetobacter sp. SWAC57]